MANVLLNLHLVHDGGIYAFVAREAIGIEQAIVSPVRFEVLRELFEVVEVAVMQHSVAIQRLRARGGMGWVENVN